MERRFMNGRLIRAAAGAVTAGLLATAAVGTQTALAAPRGVVNVPCSAVALTAAVQGASSGETLSLAPLCSYGLTAALPPISENLTIDGNHATLERSAAAGTPEFAVLTVGLNHGSAIGTLATSNLNIRNGDPGINLVQGTLSVQGGTFISNTTAISSAFYTTLSVTGARFTDNTGREGGAIFSSWNTTVTDSTFTGNSALLGGAMYAQYGTQTIAHCHFAGNTATGGGGALYDDSEITMTDSTFDSNHAGAGGAITVFDPSNASLAVTGSSFVANTAQDGGAIYNYDGLTATDDVFTANQATQGGAIDQDWYATLTGDLVTRNTAAASGGGLYAGYHTMVHDSVLTRNTAGAQGGGIYSGLSSLGFGGPLVVGGSTITGNSAGTDGGGIFGHNTLGATAGIAGSVVAGNAPDNCAPPGAISGCAAMAVTRNATGLPGDRGRPAVWRSAPWRSAPWRSVPSHHGGHLPPLLLRELTGR
jgi:predicted outer membrane repeat protein